MMVGNMRESPFVLASDRNVGEFAIARHLRRQGWIVPGAFENVSWYMRLKYLWTDQLYYSIYDGHRRQPDEAAENHCPRRAHSNSVHHIHTKPTSGRYIALQVLCRADKVNRRFKIWTISSNHHPLCRNCDLAR